MLKCLAVLQPWASLIVHGFKSYETHRWVTQLRGPLLIQASRRFDLACRNLAAQDPFASCLASAGYKTPYDLPLGKIVGIVNIADSFPVEQIAPSLDSTELQFGDYRPGRLRRRERRAATAECVCGFGRKPINRCDCVSTIGTMWQRPAGSGTSGNAFQGTPRLPGSLRNACHAGALRLATLEMSFNELPCFREAKALIGSR
jgi:hypothetical protein